MPIFVLICTDKPDVVALRAATRERHLAHIDRYGEAVRLAGPMLRENGDTAGSVLLFEAEDLAAAQAFADADPYSQAGVFADVTVAPFRLVRGKLG